MGTRITLQAMAALIRQGADSGRFHNFVSTMLPTDFPSLDRWIRGHFRYRPENQEVVRTADFMLTDLQTKGYVEGDCDCITVFYSTVLRVYGFRVRLIAIRYSDPFEFQHVFGEFFNGSRWVRFDPTVDPGTIHVEIERMVESV